MLTPRLQRDGRRLASVRAVAEFAGDPQRQQRCPVCDILAALPLVRALARVRTATPDAAEALACATLQRALVALTDDPAAERPAGEDFRPWLLELQRDLFVTARFAAASIDGCGEAVVAEPGRGATAAWQVLHRALLALPDQLREALVLADGAGYDSAELARLSGCRTAAIRDRVREARAALLAALAPPRSERSTFGGRGACRLSFDFRRGPRPVADARPAATVQSAVRQSVLSPRPRALPPADEALDDEQCFARRLGIALYAALLRGCADGGQRRALGQLLVDEAAGSLPASGQSTRASRIGRASRTNWLRLMFIAYASPAPGRVDSSGNLAVSANSG